MVTSSDQHNSVHRIAMGTSSEQHNSVHRIAMGTSSEQHNSVHRIAMGTSSDQHTVQQSPDSETPVPRSSRRSSLGLYVLGKIQVTLQPAAEVFPDVARGTVPSWA